MEAQTIDNNLPMNAAAQTVNTSPTLLERLVSVALKQLREGHLEVRFPTGARFEYTGDTRFELRADMQIRSNRTLLRILKSGAIGLAEGYMAGEWTTSHPGNLLTLLAANQAAFNRKLPSTGISRLANRLRHFLNRNSRRGSRRNIAYHYDLGNDFYRLWLDQSMTYSAALYQSNGDKTETEVSLAEAQARKYAHLANQLGIKPGDHVLEIGCGWGGFAEFAASQLDCHVTGVTLSREQLDFARQRIDRAGLARKVDLHLMDYRDLTGQFDHIVSIEMLEAVGEDFWPQYFHQLDLLLKPGGRAGIQVITIHNERFRHYRRNMDFIQKYIFPGGMLPSDNILKAQFSMAGLELADQTDFGIDYFKTLIEWEQAFDANIPAIRSMGYDQQFIHMWRFYLAYCQAGFHEGIIDVSQYVLKKSSARSRCNKP